MGLGHFGNVMSIPALVGILVLLLGKVFAASRLSKIKDFLILSSVAELGLILVGFALGDSNGIVGAGFHLLYQLIVRLLIYFAAMQLIKATNTERLSGLTGIVKKEPFLVTILGFGLFSALGISPFKGSISKLLIVYSAVSAQNYLLAFLIVLVSLIEAGCFLKIFHVLFLKEPSEDSKLSGGANRDKQLTTAAKGIFIGVSLITALITLFQEPIMHLLVNLLSQLFPTNVEAVVELESNWSWLVLVPYVGAFIVYFLGKVSVSLRNIMAVAISLASVVLTWQSGSLDGLSKLFALVMTVVCLLVTIYSTAYFKNKSYSDRYFFFLLLLQASLVGITSTNHLGNFYAFWELMTWSSYLLVIHEQTKEALEAGYKYFMMCTAGAYAILLAALTIQAQVGGGSLTEVANHLDKLPLTLILILSLAFFAGFAVKIGLVPVHSWLPAAHPVAPSSISAPMSGILTKIGIYGVLKLVFMVFGAALLAASNLTGHFQIGSLIAFLGAVTVLYGDLIALKQTDVKRMLAFSTMAQVGEMVIAIGVANYVGLVGGLSHVLNHAIMKNLLFLAVGAIIYRAKSREISKLKGIGRQMPITSLCFSIGILGIMGLPPFGGFVSKFLMLYGLIQAQQWIYAGVILLGSFIGAFYYLRLIKTIYFEKYEGPAVSEVSVAMLLPSVGLAALVVVNGLFPQFALSLVKPAADAVAAASNMVITGVPDLTITWPLAVIIPMAGGALAYFAGKYSPKLSGWVGVVSLAITAITVVWSTETFSISTIFALLIALVGVLNLLYSVGYMDHSHAQNRFYFFFLTMIGGLIGVALSRDLFSFFSFWEIMSSWALYFTIIHEETREALREGFKYFIFNYAGASLMMLGILLLTVAAGTFDLQLLGERLQTIAPVELVIGLVLITAGFFMKAAMLPVRIDYQMHPPEAPTPVSGYISSVLLKSAPFGIIKLLYMAFGISAVTKIFNSIAGIEIGQLMAWISGLTILWAVAMALQQSDMKKLLIYHTVSQMGYILLGISLGTALGIAGGLLHLVNHMFFKNLLFLGAGAIMYRTGVKSLDDLGGLAKRMPITTTVFVIGAFSISGIPPFNGFISKWLIYQAAMDKGEVSLAIISLFASVLTMASFMKFLHSAFFGQIPDRLTQVREVPATMSVPMVLLAGLCILFGVIPGLPLGLIAQIQSQIGQSSINLSQFNLYSADGSWLLGTLTVLLLIGGLIGAVVYSTYNRKIRYTEVYTCGNVDLKPEELQVSSHHLYETPKQLMKSGLVSIKRLFGLDRG